MTPNIFIDSARMITHIRTTVFHFTSCLVELKFRKHNPIRWITKVDHTFTITMHDGNQLILTYVPISDDGIQLSFTYEGLEALRNKYDITTSDLCQVSVDCHA